MAKEPTPLPTKTVRIQEGVARVVVLQKPPPPPAPPPKRLEPRVAVIWLTSPACRED